MIFQHEEVFKCFRAIIGVRVTSSICTKRLLRALSRSLSGDFTIVSRKRPTQWIIFDAKLFANDSTKFCVYLFKSLRPTTSLFPLLSISRHHLRFSYSFTCSIALQFLKYPQFFFLLKCECRKQASYFKLNFLSIIIELDHAK